MHRSHMQSLHKIQRTKKRKKSNKYLHCHWLKIKQNKCFTAAAVYASQPSVAANEEANINANVHTAQKYISIRSHGILGNL